MSLDPEALYTLLVGILFAVWLLASLIHQFRFPWWQRLASYDRLRLLPRWTFFAPNPGRQDLHLLYRSWENGQSRSWQELEIAHSGHRWRWLWNPERYPNKALSDLVQGLLVNNASLSEQDTPRLVMLSGYYLSLLALVMEQPPASPGDERQFAIVATQGFDSNRPLDLKFISERHRVES